MSGSVIVAGARTPMGRMAHEDEMNGGVIFLLSDASSYCTASVITVSAGR